ncbi:MAG: helix-turn-helix domain-containing protein [Spirochaetes bacterium]|jgi:AraC-like DNA-binding protein|nr:helix-turn-helix domain-containing protein [Spirochaetota bacterium]
MNSSTQLISEILGIAGGLVILVFMGLYRSENRRISQGIPLIIMTQVLSLIFHLVLQFTGWTQKFPGLTWSSTLISAIFLLFLINSYFMEQPFHNMRQLFHLIPLLFSITSSLFFIIPDFNFATSLSHPLVERSLFIFSVLLTLLYLLLSGTTISRHFKRLERHFSSINYTTRRVIKLFYVSLVILLIFSLIPATILSFESSIELQNYFTLISASRTIPLFIFYFFSIALILSPPLPLTTTDDFTAGVVNIELKDVQTIYNRIISELEKQKLYLIPDLTLGVAAEKIKIPAEEMCAAIQQIKGVNFYNLINELRIKESLKLLENPLCKNFPFVTIACQAGFKSELSFKRVFKKLTGIKPNEYRKQHESESESKSI